MHTRKENGSLWSVILAGGDGQRMRPLIQRWQGNNRPKQYCTFVGSRSMFQHTLDRADLLVPAARRVSVVARAHQAEVLAQMAQRQPGKILYQPANHDTAAGIFLALAYVLAQDPGATVAIFPSDHFIVPEDRFIETVRTATQALNAWPKRIILLGAAPDCPDSDYGWIQPGSELGWWNGVPVWSVRSFVEKPAAAAARQAMEAGALWNTLVIVAQVANLWSLGRQCFPRLVDLFQGFLLAINSEREESVLRDIYREMPEHNFSSALLPRVADRVSVIQLRDIVWSDWGRPERIADTLDTLGKKPAFPSKYLQAS